MFILKTFNILYTMYNINFNYHVYNKCLNFYSPDDVQC